MFISDTIGDLPHYSKKMVKDSKQIRDDLSIIQSHLHRANYCVPGYIIKNSLTNNDHDLVKALVELLQLD